MGSAFGILLFVALGALWKLFEQRGVLAEYEILLERERAKVRELERIAGIEQALPAPVGGDANRGSALGAIARVLVANAQQYPYLCAQDDAPAIVFSVVARQRERDLAAGIKTPAAMSVHEAAALAERYYRSKSA